MHNRDSISQRWFDSSAVTVSIEKGLEGIFDTQDYARLSGALSGSTVEVSAFHGILHLEVRHPGVVKMHRELSFSLDSGSWSIYNSKFRLAPEYWGQDIAARSISVQAKAAQELGMARISTLAVGDFQAANHPSKQERWAGYWVWPRLGFDGEIPQGTRRNLPLALNGCRTVSDLLATEEGRASWLRWGESVSLHFDVRPGSLSWHRLSLYTGTRGIRI